MLNNAIIGFNGTDFLNYVKYADTNNYNDKSENAKLVALPYPLVGFTWDYVVELKKDYHGIESIINYSNNSFELTKKVEEHVAEPYISEKRYIGTAGNNTYIAYIAPLTNKNELPSLPGNSQQTYKVRTFAPTKHYVLTGDGNDDITLPEGGDDTLVGNAGNDVLNGGAGNDKYVFGKEFGNDTIIDPSGKDKIVFTDYVLSEITISGNKITCGSNTIEISTQSRRTDAVTVVDKDNNTQTIEFSKVRLASIEKNVVSDASKNIKVFGNAEISIYDEAEELIESICIDESTETSVEYKDYGMVAYFPQAFGLTLPPEVYIVKIKSDEVVSVCAVSDADNPTVARQTFVENQDLSDGSMIVINTGEMVEEQLSVKLVNGDEQQDIYSEVPENFTITADKTTIKTGETITMSIPETFADSVIWECANNNVIISKNEDLSVSVIGYTPGEETVRAYLSNDELYAAEFSFEITQDSAPDVSVTSNDEIYDGSTMATYDVIFDVVIPDGYDKVVLDTSTPYAQVEDTNTFIVNSVGDHSISIYCQNSETGARTQSFTFKFSQDSEAPVISGVEEGGVYYIDRIIEIYDTELGSIYLNNELCNSDNLTVSEVGSHTIVATDVAGNKTEISFVIKDIALLSVRNESDGELVSEIRKDFERTKYSFSEEKMNSFEIAISALEDSANELPKIADFETEASGENVVVSVGLKNISDDAIVIAVSYVDDKTAEVRKLVSENGIYKGTFFAADVSKFRVFVWNASAMPIAKSKEYTYSEI